ncbi:MAG: hypothetical protein IKL44_00890 [Clostridia bacterium]|nr:hypothetical protein [Clostridia bacterium]
MDIKKLLANERAHRSLPFWSWNDKLEENEIRRQVNVMNDTNNGGFFMHARGGLQTEYLGEEWYQMIAASIDEAKKLGMDAWAYDENGWPSGFADGKVPSRGLDWQQKQMTSCILEGEEVPEHLIGLYKLTENGYEKTDKPEKGVLAVYFIVNKYYIDTFNPDTIKYFIEVTHEEYYKRFENEFGKTLKGFFTDEPQFNNTLHFPWSHVLENDFVARYGYSLIENLPALFGTYENTFAVRYDFWKMIGELFRERFLKTIYDWCEEHNCMLTGHVMCDVALNTQVRAVADSMACYEYFHIPGIDWLGRQIGCAIAAKQLSSVAAQLGRQTITESFALCGWDVSPNDLRLIAGWQYVNGITMICQHLEAYTLRGLRKRDYPAALFMQLPWYDTAYSKLNTYFAKLGSMLRTADEPAPLLVIHPIFTASLLFADNNSRSMDYYSEYYDAFTDRLNDAHLLHHYGSEVIMKRFGKVVGNKIKIGNCEYESVLLPKLSVIDESTYEMLIEFAENGGKLYAISIPDMINGRADGRVENLRRLATMIDEDNLAAMHTDSMPSLSVGNGELARVHIAERRVEDEKFFYMINLENEVRAGRFTTSGEYSLSLFDVVTEKEEPIACVSKNGTTVADLTFAPWEAKVILARKQAAEVTNEKCEYIKLDKMFTRVGGSLNTLTLDSCEYSVDGGEWQDEKAVILLFQELLELKKPCRAKLRFKFNVEAIPNELYLLSETPSQFKLIINGEETDFIDIGYEVDKSFRKMDISRFVKLGENEILLDTDFYQSQKVYDVIFGENVDETERNKLTYDTEIESIYLYGDFGVRSLDEYTYGERRSIFTGRSFALCERKSEVDITALTTEDNLFFCGVMDLKQTVTVEKQAGVRYKLRLSALNAPCAEVFVGGKNAGMFMFTPHVLDLTDYLADGENELVIRLYSGNRNMLGPHHKPAGEIYDVGPATFTDKYGWSDDRSLPAWTDNFSFVKFGMEF